MSKNNKQKNERRALYSLARLRKAAKEVLTRAEGNPFSPGFATFAGMHYPSKVDINNGYQVVVKLVKWSRAREQVHPETGGLMTVKTSGEKRILRGETVMNFAAACGYVKAPPPETYWHKAGRYATHCCLAIVVGLAVWKCIELLTAAFK